MAQERHLYAKLGGGTNEFVHDAAKFVPRPSYLVLDQDKMSFATVANAAGGTHKIFYEIFGNGPCAIVLIMGLAGCHVQFEPQIKEFAVKRADEYSVLVIDNRGVGFSETPLHRWRTSDMASDVVQVLTQVDKAEEGDRWARNVNIVGLSMGGMIAQEVVLMDPSRFGSLTLIATHAGGIVGTLPPPHGALPLMQTFGGLGGPGALDAGMALLFPEEHLKEPISPQVLDEHAPEEELKTKREQYAYEMIRRARKYVESGNAPEVRLPGVFLQICAVVSHYVSWSRLDSLKKWQMPVLVINGAKDNLVSNINSRMISRHLNCKWLHFEQAGHGVNEQYVKQCNEALDAHFQAGKSQPYDPLRKSHPPELFHPWKIVGGATLALYLLQKRFKLPRTLLLLKAALLAAVLRKLYGGFLRHV